MFGYIPNIVSFFDFEGLICVFREVYFRFKGITPEILRKLVEGLR